MTTIQKVALVTAGTAGLGAAICHSLAQSGFRLVRIKHLPRPYDSRADHLVEQAINFANNGERAKTLIEQLSKIPSTTTASDKPRFESFRADVGDRPAVQKLVQDTVSSFGRIDVVVSNAGWTRVTNFANLEEGMIDEVNRPPWRSELPHSSLHKRRELMKIVGLGQVFQCVIHSTIATKWKC